MKNLSIYKASAGSGKTFTLAVEYIALLAINPMEYQNILAVTFTNKATAEMKQRILSTLYAIAHGLQEGEGYVENILTNLAERKKMPQYQEEPYLSVLQNMNRDMLRKRAKEALSNIIHDYSRFHIETIDSFFQGIVHEIANELELSTKMKVELDETEVLSDAITQIIENLKEGSSEFRTIIDFIEEKIQKNHSWQVEETVKEFGRNIFKEKYLIHGEEVRRKITNFSEIYKYRALIHQYLEQKRQTVIMLGYKMLEAYENIGITEEDGSKNIVTFMEKVRDYNITEPTNKSRGTFSDSIETYTEDAGKWFKKSSKNRDTLLPQVETVLMPMLTEAFEKHQEYVSHLHTVNAIGQHLYSLMLLNEISQMVKLLNEKGNRFLLSETANFLRNVINNQDIPFIYEKTGAVIKHIMIDEFQDTSTLQWENFKPLIQNSLSMGGSCLIVGDVKQSIYRFRNSDWQILNNIENDSDLKSHMGKIPATYNFRSAKHVVEFNNEIFQNAVNLLKQNCPALSMAYGDVAQIARKEDETGFVKIENIDYHDIDPDHLPEVWDKSISADYDEATLQRIQLSIKELIDNKVNPNDITILTRTNREVPQICEYFNEHQDILTVKVVSDDAFRLDASPAINIIICALRVLAEPDSKLHLATLTHHATSIPDAFNEKERADIRFSPITEQIEYIYRIFRLDQIPNQDAYLFFFNDIVEQFCQENLTDLDSFLKAWDESLGEKTIPGSAADGVRIMTMHKSKGLEFHSVIIPSCSWAIKPKDTEVMWCVPDREPYDLMPLLPISVNQAKDDSIFADDRREEELRTLVDNINVLYVAFTRAKHNLIILTGNKLQEKRGRGKENAELEDTIATIENAQSFLINAMPAKMEKTEIEEIITRYQYGTIVPSQKKDMPDNTKEQNVIDCEHTPLPVAFASYPSVAQYRQSYESDMFITADSENLQTQQHTERIRLISLGNLYHSIFEHIHTIDDVPHAIHLLESKGCFGSILNAKEAQEAVTQMIEKITIPHPEWFSPEWKTLNERAILFLEKKMMTTKRPDRVVVKNKKAVIIDYKTAQGAVKQQENGTFSAPAENKQQIEEYKRLLFEIGYTDVEAYLWYILDDIILPV